MWMRWGLGRGIGKGRWGEWGGEGQGGAVVLCWKCMGRHY